MKATIIFLGPPGSGKGTQSAMLAEKLGMLHLSMGRYLREQRESYPEFYRMMKEGVLVSDDKIFEILKECILEKRPDGIILDGTPRSLEQYNLIKPWLQEYGSPIKMAIYLRISQQEAVKRLRGRRKDPKTGYVYNLTTNPPPESVDKSRLITREDDSPQSIKKRFDTYRKRTTPLLELLESESLLQTIDAQRDIQVIHKDILKLFKQ